jgi:hypothetical protein
MLLTRGVALSCCFAVTPKFANTISAPLSVVSYITRTPRAAPLSVVSYITRTPRAALGSASPPSRTALSVGGNPPTLVWMIQLRPLNNIQTKNGERRAGPHVQIKIVKKRGGVMQYGDKRCRKCNCAMELIADAPPMNGAGLIVWSCPQCDAVESVLTPATRSHQRYLIR